MPLAPFLIFDALLLLTAALIGWHSPAPLGLYPLLAITACVLGGSALATLPFLTRYARRHDEAQAERDNAHALLVEKQAAAAEQLSIATATLHALHTAAVASPARTTLQPPQASPTPAIHAQPSATTSAFDRVDDQAPAVAPDPALVALTAQLTVLQQQLTLLTARLADSDRSSTAHPTNTPAPAPASLAPATTVPTPRPRVARDPSSPRSSAAERSRTPPSVPAAASLPMGSSVAGTAPATPAAFDPSLTPLTLPAEPSAEDIPVDPLPDAEPPAPPPIDDGPELLLIPSTAESTPSTRPSFDGSTQLLVIAYPGQGQTLHLRGDGPGLNWITGVPLTAHRPGHWSWRTTTATAPFRVRLFKNDLTPCAALADFTLSPGQETTIHAGF